MERIKNILVVAVSFVVLWVLIFRKPQQIYKTTPTKTIERIIEGKKEYIYTNGQRIETLKKTLVEYKTYFDTVNIIKFQDSLIIFQDTQIIRLTEVTKLQDTVIDKLKFDNKRLKRQRNIAIGIAAITTGISIVK